MKRFMVCFIMLTVWIMPACLKAQEVEPLAESIEQLEIILAKMVENETSRPQTAIARSELALGAGHIEANAERRTSSELFAQVEALQREVDSLKATLAASRLDDKLAEVQGLARSLQTLAGELKTISSANMQAAPQNLQASTPPTEIGLKFSGFLFGDYFYNLARDNAQRNEKDLNGFQIRRFYLTADNAISSKLAARFRIEADEAALTSNGNIGVFVKDAFLKVNGIFAGSDLLVGLAPTPAFDVSEEAWGYRALEKTIIDFNRIVGARDQGIALIGRFDSGKVFNYQFMLANNSAVKPERDKHKRIYLRFHLIPSRQVQFTLYGDYSTQPSIADPLNPTATLNNGVFTNAAFFGLQKKEHYSVGVEAFLRTQFNGQRDATTGGRKSAKSFGVSAFGSMHVSPQLAVVGRFDSVDPNWDAAAKDDREYLFIGALDYAAHKNVHLMPNLHIRMFDRLHPAVTPRITIFWKFLS